MVFHLLPFRGLPATGNLHTLSTDMRTITYPHHLPETHRNVTGYAMWLVWWNWHCQECIKLANGEWQ